MITVKRNGIEFNVVDDTQNAFFWSLLEWESENYTLLMKQAKVHDIFVQAGAWIGPFTMYSSKLYKEVYCLEPDPEARKELERNLAANSATNVQVFNNAFYNENKIIKLGSEYSPLGCSGTSVFQEGNVIETQAITLKDFYKKNNLPKRTMLMLDVEGVEYMMLDDIEFFVEYLPTLNMSFHLPFLTDEQFNHMLESMEKLKNIYKIDVDFFLEKRKNNQYKQNYINGIPAFREFSYLFEPL